MKARRVAIAGAGLSGAVLARELAEHGDLQVVVFEQLPEVGGHCYSQRDAETGVMLHVHGAHVFHTRRRDLWDYVNRFDHFLPLEIRVKAVTARGIFPLPINLLTLNQFFGRTMTPDEAGAFLAKLGDDSIGEPRTFEEFAVKHLGLELYQNFLAGYTAKQWGVHPRQLPASIARRLPIRTSYDDRYLDDWYQGVPVSGYTVLIERMLDHPRISVQRSTRLTAEAGSDFDHLFYSGPLDSYFGERLGRLGYRSLRFERLEFDGDHQGSPLLTYCDPEVPYTRTLEHKHLAPWEEHRRTVVHREYSFATGPGQTPYYPLRLVDDERLLRQYVELAEQQRGVTFLGRLGTYRYLDMHIVVGESLELARRFVTSGGALDSAFARSPL